MSLSEQIQRVDGSQNDILKKVLGAFGVTVGENKIDQLAALAKAAPLLKENSLYSSATAALFGLGADSVPDEALALLSKAALYKTVGQTAQLSTFSEGSIIYLNENGSPVQFYVAKHDYESSLNGSGRTLVVRKDCYDNRVWDNGNVNTYASSDLDSWFNSTYKNMLDADIRSLIGTTKIRYTPGDGNWTVGTLERTVFALSATELGQSASWLNVEGSALPIANTLKVAYLSGNANTQWTRSPYPGYTRYAVYLNSDGSISDNLCNSSLGSRPAFTLPSTYMVVQPLTPGLYDVLGNLLLKLPGVQIATGSYVGTGTAGSSNPNSLTFDFIPKVLIVQAYDWSSFNAGSDDFLNFAIMVNGISLYMGVQSDSNVTSKSVSVTWNGNTVSWYSTTSNAMSQLNGGSEKYFYVAFG